MTEIDALKTVDEALAGLADDAARGRVLRWACQKYAVTDAEQSVAARNAAGNSPAAEPSSGRKKLPLKAKGKPKAKTAASSPSLVRDLNLKPRGKDAFDKFAAAKNPISNQHKCVAAVYYLRHELDLSQITADHVYTCFKHMHWRVPSSLANTLAYVASVHGWLDTRNMADIKLTTIGENLVEHDLPQSKGSKE